MECNHLRFEVLTAMLLKIIKVWSDVTSGTTYPMTQCHISEDTDIM